MTEGATKDYPDASLTDPSDWQYVSEGGATIVFSYKGPQHSDFTGTVLRLRKASLNHLSASDDNSERYAGADVEEPDDPTIAFQQRVTSKLIAPSFLPRLEVVRVERSWLERLKSFAEEDRPLDRRQKDTIDTSRRKAVLATDLVGGEGWSVEIKPKWGFLPNPAHLSPETKDVKIQRCRYCMHNQYRSKKGKGISQEYCPLDLYSGDEKRVSLALRRLWEGWMRGGSFNNLRIFVHGKLVDPKNVNNNLNFLGLNGDDGRHMGADELSEAFVASFVPFLLETSVFKVLSRLQRTLDALDIEGLFALHAQSQASSSNPALEKMFPDPSIDEWEQFVDIYLDAGFQGTLNHEKPDIEHLRYYTMAFLMSASFKDCSVIIRASKPGRVPDSATVIDLDPKSMDRLRKWFDLDHMLATSFEDDRRRRCIDSA